MKVTVFTISAFSKLYNFWQVLHRLRFVSRMSSGYPRSNTDIKYHSALIPSDDYYSSGHIMITWSDDDN
jgi:hypothetical protein